MIEMMIGQGADSGEAVFLTPGTHSWTVPAGVESISVVAVGSGHSDPGIRGGGHAGALVYKKAVAVTPGSTLTVTVGGDNVDSEVTDILRAGSGRAWNSGRIITGDLGGRGGRGGQYLAGYGGGGGSAGRYDGPGGNGAACGIDQGYDIYWDYLYYSNNNNDYPFDEFINGGSGYRGKDSLPNTSTRDIGHIVCVRIGTTDNNYYWHKLTQVPDEYYPVAATGVEGQGRGGAAVRHASGSDLDGEGVGLEGSNITPPDNGYGYGGGYNRPGGQGAVRIIWGKDRAFPSSKAGSEHSAIKETY